jgi:phospholysine phosphohistidine inorganic pyrophosphate phosphatase
MRAILLDLDGVIYQGDQPIEGAAEVIAWIRGELIPHLFLTNTSSRPRSELCRKLGDMGIAIDPEQILSPPAAAARWLRAQGAGPVALFVPPATQTEFAGLPRWNGDSNQAVGAVVIGDLAEAWTFARLNRDRHRAGGDGQAGTGVFPLGRRHAGFGAGPGADGRRRYSW